MRPACCSASVWSISWPATAAFQVLFTPTARRSIQGFFFVQEHLVVQVLDDLAPAPFVVTPAGNWAQAPLAGLPRLGTVSVWLLDAEEDELDGTLLALTQDPLTPPTLLLIAAGTRGACEC